MKETKRFYIKSNSTQVVCSFHDTKAEALKVLEELQDMDLVIVDTNSLGYVKNTDIDDSHYILHY